MSYKDIMDGLRRRCDELKEISPVFEEIAGDTSLTAVDPDAESAIELKARIARQLPNVRSAVYEDVAENWAAGTDQVFDVVMLHNCVSDIPKSAVQPAFRVRDQAKRPFHNHHADQTL